MSVCWVWHHTLLANVTFELTIWFVWSHVDIILLPMVVESIYLEGPTQVGLSPDPWSNPSGNHFFFFCSIMFPEGPTSKAYTSSNYKYMRDIGMKCVNLLKIRNVKLSLTSLFGGRDYLRTHPSWILTWPWTKPSWDFSLWWSLVSWRAHSSWIITWPLIKSFWELFLLLVR